MKLRNLFHPHREGREEMEAMADQGILSPAMLGPVPDELTEEIPVVKRSIIERRQGERVEKPLKRCHHCQVVTTLPVCSLCVSRGLVAPDVAETVEIAAFSIPYNWDAELPRRTPRSHVTVLDGWRYPG